MPKKNLTINPDKGKVFAVWYGGSNYATPDLFNRKDVEMFLSIQEAKDEFEDRFHDPYYPCVGDNAEMWLFLGYDPFEDGDAYPDRIIKRGPRRGIRVERV